MYGTADQIPRPNVARFRQARTDVDRDPLFHIPLESDEGEGGLFDVTRRHHSYQNQGYRQRDHFGVDTRYSWSGHI